MNLRLATGLALDRDVRRAARRAAVPVGRLGLAVGRHLARRQAAELGLAAPAHGRTRRRIGVALLGAGGLAAGAALMADPRRRRRLAGLIGRPTTRRFGPF
jgi:hypothetical protein